MKSTTIVHFLTLSLAVCLIDVCPSTTTAATLADNNTAFRVSLDESFRFVVEGSGRLGGVALGSASRSLSPVPDDESRPFAFLLENTSGSIAWGTLSPISVDGAIALPASWNFLSGITDVQYELAIVDTDSAELLPVGPFELVDYGSCADCALPFVSIDPSGALQLVGYQTDIHGLHLLSASGSLQTFDVENGSAAPSLGNIIAAFSTPFELILNRDGGFSSEELQSLPPIWNPLGQPDIQLELLLADGQVGPFTLPAATYPVPEPQSVLVGLLTAVAIYRRRNCTVVR